MNPSPTEITSQETEIPPLPEQRERLLQLKERLLIGRRVCFTIEDDAVQMASADHWGQRALLVAARKVYIPTATTAAAKRRAAIIEALHEFAKDNHSQRAKFVLAVKGAETVFRVFYMPSLKESDLRSAIQFEAKKQLPFPIEDCYFDYRVVSDVELAGQKKKKIALFAALKTHVDQRLELFSELGLSISHIMHAQETLGQLLADLPFYDQQGGFSLLGIERNRSDMSYYRGTTLEFSHGIGLGSSFLSNRVDATMYEYFAEAMAGEIQNSLDYYAGQFSSLGGNQVFVHGDLAYSDDLINLLSDRFGFSFRRFPAEDLRSIGRLPEEVRDSVSVCLSAVSAALAHTSTSNLLPRPLQIRLQQQRVERFLLLGVVATILLLAALSVIDLQSTSTQRNNLAAIVRHQEDLRSSPLFARYAEAVDLITRNRQYLANSVAAPSYWHNNLKELSLITPEGIRLTQIEVTADLTDQNLHVSGEAIARATPPELLLAEFVSRMTQSPFYDRVDVVRYHRSRIDAGQRLEFQIVCRGEW